MSDIKTHNHFKPGKHKGVLPVRVLQHNIIDWFEQSYPDFLADAKHEIQSGGLKQGIQYHEEQAPIVHTAGIDPSKAIHLYEPFIQFVWCNCYAMVVGFEEGILTPMNNGTYKGVMAFTDEVKGALQVFRYGLSLTKRYQPMSLSLPNPEQYHDDLRPRIENANGVCVAALNFILLHEFGHQYYGHLDARPSSPAESKRREHDCDEFACEKLQAQFGSHKGRTLKLGAICGSASIVLLDDSLSGGQEHPDPDERLSNVLGWLCLDSTDSYWGIASFMYRLWSIHYEKPYTLPPVVDDFQAMFNATSAAISQLKMGG
ncbi:MAG: hypothetical protein K8T26_01560 [Lentisphaerae bacterium]|nr:hypothetical protein [Lentisphaerota bacterium]